MRKHLITRIKRRVLRQIFKSLGSVNNYSYVFIVTYGRSGSTLLMSLLNMIPGYKIHGENYNALYRIYQADAAITKAHRMCSGNSKHRFPQSPWYGILRARPYLFRHQLVEGFVAHVLRPEPGDRVLGFKEIRYTKSDVPDLKEFLEFLRRAFPDCKIIFNHRNASAVAESSWWALNPEAVEKIEAADARMLAVPADERHFHFFYDEINESMGNVRELFRFLGEEFDERVAREVLGTLHSPPPAKYAKRTPGHSAPT